MLNGAEAARGVASAAYTDFSRGRRCRSRARFAQALPQLPDAADDLNAIAKDLGVATSDIHLGNDASETTVKRATFTDCDIVLFATHGLVAGDVKRPRCGVALGDAWLISAMRLRRGMPIRRSGVRSHWRARSR
jgi:CHAT domain-containing protein